MPSKKLLVVRLGDTRGRFNDHGFLSRLFDKAADEPRATGEDGGDR